MKNNGIKYIIIALAAAFLFLPFLGHVHLFDWDEINFAEAAREMLVSKDYLRVQIDFRPFWEKPPLFIWMQALSMAVFGVNEFAARFPNALIGMITLCSFFYVGKRIVNERMAWIWVIVYAVSWLPHFYFKTAIIDPAFNLFIFLSFFQVHLITHERRRILHAVLAGFFLGLAVLTKGPVAILVALLSLGAYLVLNKGFWGLGIRPFLWLALACFITAFSWFGIDIIRNGWWFTREFLAYQVRLLRTPDAGHGGPFYYHFMVLLLGCFPASLFLFQRRNPQRHLPVKKEQDFTRWMWILFWVVLILFSLVKTKIVHYSSLCYFPLSFLAALHLSRIEDYGRRWKTILRWLLLLTGSIWALILTLLPVLGNHKDLLAPYLKDDFALANLQADVSWSYAFSVLGLLYLAGLIVVFILSRRVFEKGLLVLFVMQIIIIPLTMIYCSPKIEAYSQGAAIHFYQEFSGKDVYVVPVGFKSYAHLFYTKKQDKNSSEYEQKGLPWLMEGRVNKPVYFICKIDYAEQLRQEPDLQQIGQKNGFVFFKRKDQ